MLTKPQASRRTRITASVAAVALGVVSMGVATGIAEAAGGTLVPAANKNLDAQCGLDIGVILDGSGSIANPGKGTSQNPISAVPDVQAAAKALLSPLTDTNTNAGIVTFSEAMKSNATVSMQALTGGAYSSTFVPQIDAYSAGGWTNWDLALRTAKQNFLDSAGNRAGVPNLIVFITDGAPNTIGGATGTTNVDTITGGEFSDGADGAVNPAITAANAIKNTADTHILTIGAGQAFSTNANAVTFRKALAQVSGGGTAVFGSNSGSSTFDAFDPDNTLTAAEKGTNKYTVQSPLNVSTADVVFVKSFSDLGTQLGDIAKKLCGGSLIVKKMVSTPENPNTYNNATDPWRFKATPSAANSSYSWIQPTVSENDTNQTGQTSGAQASTTFQWKITNAPTWNNSKNVAVDEEEQANYVFDSVSCTKPVAGQQDANVDVSGVNTGNGQFTVPVGAADIVTCVVKNKAQKRIDLELDKTFVGDAQPAIDTNGTWNLSLKNKGPSDATGVVVKDYVPAGFVVNTGALPAEATLSSGVITWNVGNVANGQTKSLDIAGLLNAEGSMTNWAQVTSANEIDTDSTPNNCTLVNGQLVNPEDDCDKETINVNRLYSLDIAKSVVGNTTVGIGDTVEYDLKVKNNGPSTALSGFVVTDQVDPGLTNVEVTSAAPWNCSATVGNAVSCTYNANLAKASGNPAAPVVSVRVKATVGDDLADAESVPNTACVKKNANSTSNDDCDRADINLTPKSDLEITKKSIPDPSFVVTGSNASWKYSVKNLGPSIKKSAFTVTDTLPANLTDVQITEGAGWDCSAVAGVTFTCTYTPDGGLAVGDSTSDLTLTASTEDVVPDQGSTTPLENKACVEDNYNETQSKTGASEGQNDCSTAIVTVTPKVDLQMNKDVDVESGATVGDTLTYTFSVTNNGPSTATSFSFQDTFDSGLLPTLVSEGDWNCTLDGQDLSCDWDGDALAKGATTAPPVVVTAVVQASLADAANVKNTACVEDDIKGDENDCDTTTTDLDPKYDLVIDKNQVEENPVAVGGTVTYDLTVSNQGPSKATSGFLVTDTVPSLLTVTGVDGGDDWKCATVVDNLVSCTWIGDDLAVGPAPKITVTATVTEDAANAESVFNTACVAVSDDNVDNGEVRDLRAALVLDEDTEVLSECDTVETEFPSGKLTLGKTAYLNKAETVGGNGTTLEGFGGTITYVLGATATSTSGTLDQKDVVVTDTVPTIGTPAGNELDTTLVPGSVICVNGPDPATNAPVACDVDDVPADLSWNVGTVTSGTTKWVQFKVTVDVPGADNVDTEITTFDVKNVGAVTSSYEKKPIPSNEVTTPVVVEWKTGIEITKTVSNNPGGPIEEANFFPVVAGVVNEKSTFRFEVTNNSTTAVRDLVLTDDNLRFAVNQDAANLEKDGTPYVDSSLIENCRVGLTLDPVDGFGTAFNLGEVIPGVEIAPKQKLALYCDITVPDIQPASLYETDGNRIYNDASIDGTADGLGPVENDSNVASIVLFAEKLDIFPIKSIVDQDGTNPRGFDNLGKITTPTLTTFDMTVDNVSDTAYEVNLYDYFLNASPGLTTAQRDAIFNNMVCLDFDLGGDFPTTADFAAGPEFFDQNSPTNESTTFGPATNGKGAGTFLARSAAPLLIVPGDGYEVVCQTTLPVGDYSLTNAFRMVANPVQGEIEPERVARAADAATGSLDVIATAGIVVGVPSDGGGGEEEEPGTTPEPAVKGTKLPATGSGIPAGTLLAFGIALVGTGVMLGLAARRRDENGEQI